MALLLRTGETVTCVAVIPDWLKAVVLKSLAADTCTWYEIAPDEALHCRLGLVATPVALLAGEDSIGAGGGGGAVAKIQTDDQLLLPALLEACTLQ